MVSTPPTNLTNLLDSRREASMADEGGWSAALVETEEPALVTMAAPVSHEEPETERPAERPRGGPRRLWSSVALGAAVAIAKLTSRARRIAARRAHARVHGH